MSRVVCRRGVARGSVSRDFTPDHLVDALKGNYTEHVYVELDSSGWVSEAGGRGAARLCVSARLAPHVPAAAALLTLADAPQAAPLLRLRAQADLPPYAELLLWFSDDVLAALDMPFLTLRNIRGRRDYTCHECGATFDDPNPLKVHLFLSCRDYDPAQFWRCAADRLRAARPPAPARLEPAQLEALATEWGRARGGHVCVYCGKLYSRRYGLKIHLRTHTGYRPLRCRYCLRAFGDPSNLNKHERLHAAGGAAPYSCGACGRGAARRRDLLRHARTHAGAAAADKE